MCFRFSDMPRAVDNRCLAAHPELSQVNSADTEVEHVSNHVAILRRCRTEARTTVRSIKKTYDATLPHTIESSIAAYGSFILPGYIRLPSSAVSYPLLKITTILVNL
jgi:hypothetical protein